MIWLDADMTRLHIETSGSGPDLVMLHGWAMHSGVWECVSEPLSRRFHLHCIDLPGHGASRDCALDSLEQMTEVIADHLPDNSIVCGWSLGGQVAIRLALQMPERVQQLVLVASTPCFVKRANWPWGMESLTLTLFMENLARDYMQTLNRFLTLQVSGSEDQTRVLARLRKSMLSGLSPEFATLQAGLKILQTSDLRAELDQIKQPVLLIHGQNDVIAPVGAAEWTQQYLSQAQLKLFPHCGHAPFLSFPEQFVGCFDAL
ncbi:carboxylesterase BioH (pimeloyl-CoA synthesis) [Nitrosomonas eutropha]|uniref:pimeloyl-ACP methyl ester esterase BioH n=1 Tax=Nitrosomonas eutropha TaxID=916 RepID=UPI00088810B1|nr:pimeloyl-ACP methyl ester esterase BioH [Nitrosomonas eutropha]SCX17441.1 carboxylesterase BioH (pimeloyl-CoA synthesis) [Nitrosomonas eutropha]